MNVFEVMADVRKQELKKKYREVVLQIDDIDAKIERLKTLYKANDPKWEVLTSHYREIKKELFKLKLDTGNKITVYETEDGE